MVDANPAAQRLLHIQGRGRSDLPGLFDLLGCRSGADLGRKIARVPPAGHLRLASAKGDILEVVQEGGALRLTLRLNEGAIASFERLSLDAAEAELTLLRGIAENAPQPI